MFNKKEKILKNIPPKFFSTNNEKRQFIKYIKNAPSGTYWKDEGIPNGWIWRGTWDKFTNKFVC